MKIMPLLLLFLLALAAPASAATLEGACQVRFFGDSTLHAFEGQGACEPFTLERTDREGVSIILPAQVVVPVASLDTDISARNKKMRGMFDSENFPKITGSFAEIDPQALIGAWQATGSGELPFNLTIREVTRPVTATVKRMNSDAKGLEASFDLDLSLADFGLEAPTVLGIIRVADKVRVEVDVQLSGELGAAAKGQQ